MQELRLSPAEEGVFLLALFAALCAFGVPIAKRVRFILAGRPDHLHFNRKPGRLRRAASEVLGQSRVIGGRRPSGISHACLLWGFLLFLPYTVAHLGLAFHAPLARDVLRFPAYQLVLRFAAAVVLLAVIFLGTRRYVLRPAHLARASLDSGIVLALIGVIAGTALASRQYGPAVERTLWWGHTLAVLGFIAYIPHSKHLHIIAAPFGLILRSLSLGSIPSLDLRDAQSPHFGIWSVCDLGRKQRLDLYACTQCGRCSDVCPATTVGNHLNPQTIIQRIRHGCREPRDDEAIVGPLIDPDDMWECTTCGACELNCPTGIEHLSIINGLRRYRIADCEFPDELLDVWVSLEERGNPFGYEPHVRARRIRALDIPFFDGSQDYLLWLGCFNNFDPAHETRLRALVSLLIESGITFGVLHEEWCTGDVARRLGNEYLYQALAEKNMNLLMESGAKRILTTCPHCLHTISGEYLREEPDVRVLHYTVVLEEILRTGRLSIRGRLPGIATFHDPCYLARYRGVVDEPRSVTGRLFEDERELRRSRVSSFCCGAGGGMFFMRGPESRRISGSRAGEAVASGAQHLIAACPFCVSMLEDAAVEVPNGTGIKTWELAEAVHAAMGRPEGGGAAPR